MSNQDIKDKLSLISELEKRLSNLQANNMNFNYFYKLSVIRIINNLRGDKYSRSDDNLMKDLKSVGYHDLAKLVLVGRTI